jgi:alpha-galactosidase
MISNHVCGDRSHQVLRHTPLESRFNVAAFGILGYELDLSKLTPFDEKIIAKQVSFYKEHRQLFQYGTFHRIQSTRDTNEAIWMMMNDTKDEAIVLYFITHAKPNPRFQSIPITGLRKGVYDIQNRIQYMNIRTTGSLINHVLPVKLKVNGFLYNLIANRYLYQNEVYHTTMTNDQLKHMELRLPHTFTGTGSNDKVMMLPDYGSRLYHIKRRPS